MRHALQVEIIERLLAGRDPSGRDGPGARPGCATADERYSSQERLAAERAHLLGEHPIPIAHESEIPDPGDYLTHESTGTPILVVRTQTGRLRAFANLCRHRYARLANRPCDRGVTSLVCRHHGWVYGLDGELARIPGHPGLSAGERAALALTPLPMACAHGFVWVIARSSDPRARVDAPAVHAYLGSVGQDMADYSISDHHLYKKTVVVAECNWKRVVEAFLSGASRLQGAEDRTHDRTCFDIMNHHIRFVRGHEHLAAMARGPRETWNLRSCATTIYYIFPASLIIIHSDFISLITIFPQDANYTYYSHFMLVPRAPQSDNELARWQALHQRMDEQWFRKDDHPGDAEAWETPLFVFHDRLDAILDENIEGHASLPGRDTTEKE